jgi:hypothetical protein
MSNGNKREEESRTDVGLDNADLNYIQSCIIWRRMGRTEEPLLSLILPSVYARRQIVIPSRFEIKQCIVGSSILDVLSITTCHLFLPSSGRRTTTTSTEQAVDAEQYASNRRPLAAVTVIFWDISERNARSVRRTSFSNKSLVLVVVKTL